MPTDTNVIQSDGKLDLSWRQFLQNQYNGPIKRNNQTVTAGSQINVGQAIYQVIELEAAGAVSTDLVAFSGSVPNYGRITLVSLQNAVTIKESDTDGGCVMGGDVTLNPKEALTLMYISSLKRYVRI